MKAAGAMMENVSNQVGLIAGQGQLPVIVARGMKDAGARVCCVGLRDQYDQALPELCNTFKSAGVIQLGRWIRLLRKWNVDNAVMVGGVDKTRMHRPLTTLRQLPDLRAGRLWYKRLRHDKRNAALLAAVADELAVSGITLIDSTTYITDHLATPGSMNSVHVTEQHREDIALGWPLLTKTVELDIGQSIAVFNGDVIAVEAVEGTDRMIERAGMLCQSGGWSLIKVAKPNQDMRFDVPTIGPATIENLKRHGARMLVIEAEKTFIVDQETVLDLAERHDIIIVARRGNGK